MNDNWRLAVDLHEEGHAHALSERLEATELEHDLDDSFHDRVVVTRQAAHLYCYTGTREQAERASRLIESLAAEHGWQVTMELKRWHQVEEVWEDPDKPLPETESDRAAEEQVLVEREHQEAVERGFPEFEVRVDCPTHKDALQLVEKLKGEGLSSVHRWKYVLVGALDEEAAKSLAERLREEAPAGSTVKAEGSWQAAWAERPANPFAFLGGLAG